MSAGQVLSAGPDGPAAEATWPVPRPHAEVEDRGYELTLGREGLPRKVLVVYASRSGNTERIAHAIASGLRPANEVHVLSAEAAADQRGDDFDLLVVGAPTQIHALRLMGIRGFLRTARLNGFGALPIAAFDTRFPGDPWETGSAAGVIARRLEHEGARLAAEPESFFIDAITHQLALGEEDRAREWGMRLGRILVAA